MFRVAASKANRLGHVFAAYRREAAGPGDFFRLLRVRLARTSIVGRVICPRPIRRTVNVASFGGPVTLRSHTTDCSVTDELIVSKSYESVRRHATAPKTIVDLGANIGLTARWFAHAFPTARVIAVEPEPGNVEMLRINLAAIPGRSSIHAAAVSSERGTAMIGTSSGEHGYTITGQATGGVEVEVPVITMDDVLEADVIDSIDILKCDIEGSERDLFRDCARWIGMVDLLEVECHGDYTVETLRADLARNGGSFELRALDHVEGFGCEIGLLRRRA